ncbi:MAG: homoserine O-succinyltransferase [Gammaproteobacteria bacterium]|nr:homoserine O-succinyltransferase [Gammaproteobacteria bacterium]
MPLVAHSRLPTFERLRRDGQPVLDADRALHQDIRELHIGFLNMMPDAALEATERQFMRLIGASNRIAQFYVHPFTIEGVPREGEAKIHVDTYYEDFATLRRAGLDALIITGANPVTDEITDETFWDPLIEVLDWAHENVTSTLCSCLASHAAFLHYHGIRRTPVRPKQWGVYSHRVIEPSHPLVADMNTRFDAPHSRLNDVPRAHLEPAGIHVLVEGLEPGVLMAVSPDGLRFVYFQGHPEYDVVSLMKEFKRELGRYVTRDREDYPPYPDHYFSPGALEILERFKIELLDAEQSGRTLPEFPEAMLLPELDNTWTDTGKAIFNNWLGLVYQLTHQDRRKPFMEGIDPDDPLGMSAERIKRSIA